MSLSDVAGVLALLASALSTIGRPKGEPQRAISRNESVLWGIYAVLWFINAELVRIAAALAK